jgi:hypothetical protein
MGMTLEGRGVATPNWLSLSPASAAAALTERVRILLGLLRRDAGGVAVLSEDPWRDVVTLHRSEAGR